MTPRKLFTPLLTLATFLLLLLLAACDSGPTPAPTQPTPQSVTTFPIPPTPKPQIATTITFDTTGGIAGVHKTLTISPQGEATYTTTSTITTLTATKKTSLPITQYGTLLNQLDKADFFNLKDAYDNSNVADDFHYTITIKQGDRAKTIKAAQQGGKDLMPQPLKDFIAQLEAVQSQLEK